MKVFESTPFPLPYYFREWTFLKNADCLLRRSRSGREHEGNSFGGAIRMPLFSRLITAIVIWCFVATTPFLSPVALASNEASAEECLKKVELARMVLSQGLPLPPSAQALANDATKAAKAGDGKECMVQHDRFIAYMAEQSEKLSRCTNDIPTEEIAGLPEGSQARMEVTEAMKEVGAAQFTNDGDRCLAAVERMRLVIKGYRERQ